MTENILKTGTTTIGLVCKDGIVLAADKRVTSGGGYIVGDFQKILEIGDRFALTIAGTASDAVMLSRHLRAEVKLKELRSQNQVTVREAANLLAQFVFSNIRTPSTIPGITHFLFAGYDKDGTKLFDVFPDGTASEIDKYFCSGSGSVYAYGHIDAAYSQDMSVEDGIALAKKALSSAMKRDTASGNGYDVCVVREDGVEMLDTVLFESPMRE